MRISAGLNRVLMDQAPVCLEILGFVSHNTPRCISPQLLGLRGGSRIREVPGGQPTVARSHQAAMCDPSRCLCLCRTTPGTGTQDGAEGPWPTMQVRFQAFFSFFFCLLSNSFSAILKKNVACYSLCERWNFPCSLVGVKQMHAMHFPKSIYSFCCPF